VEGLIHISKLGKGKRIKHAEETLAKGQAVDVRIESIDEEKKRISLAFAESDNDDQGEKAEDYHKYIHTSSSPFGSLGDKLKGKFTVKLR
jgi:small subunit ribosomal protein S1